MLNGRGFISEEGECPIFLPLSFSLPFPSLRLLFRIPSSAWEREANLATSQIVFI
jgi:hypothetical protein